MEVTKKFISEYLTGVSTTPSIVEPCIMAVSYFMLCSMSINVHACVIMCVHVYTCILVMSVLLLIIFIKMIWCN